MAPADRGPGRKGGARRPAKARASSIRAAAETAAGSAASGPKRARRDAAAPLRQKPPRRRSRTSEATRQAAADAVGPAAPKPAAPKPAARKRAASKPPVVPPIGRMQIEADVPEIPDLPEPSLPEGRANFPDYEVKSDTWDPWGGSDGGPPDRTDPDFDAQRTLGEWLEGVIPPDAQVHFINAGREFAQGVQVTVDHHTGKRRPGGADGGPSRIEIE